MKVCRGPSHVLGKLPRARSIPQEPKLARIKIWQSLPDRVCQPNPMIECLNDPLEGLVLQPDTKQVCSFQAFRQLLGLCFCAALKMESRLHVLSSQAHVIGLLPPYMEADTDALRWDATAGPENGWKQ